MFCLLLFLLVFSSCAQLKPLDDVNVKEHLYNYEFLNTSDPDLVLFKTAIKKFQRINGLKETGIVDQDTLEKILAPRCGRPSSASAAQFTYSGQKWNRFHLTYKICNTTKSLSISQVSDTFKEAVRAWIKNVNLTLTETTSDNADIKIYFNYQDGLFNKLGYAYFPITGTIYFDKDEYWTTDSQLTNPETIYFGWVAAHELGHALGLPHSETMQSVMYPYYSKTVLNPSKNDLKHLRSIYGKPVLNNSNLCAGSSVDAILDSEENILISGKQYYKFSNGVVESGPYSLDTLYSNLPDKIDAAFVVRNVSYFLSKNIYYKFKNKIFLKQRLISVGFDNVPSNISAAFYDPMKTTIYFFKNSSYYALNVNLTQKKRLIVNGRSINNDWVGIPKNIDAATLLKDSQVLFIKDEKCYIMDLQSRQLLKTVNCYNTVYKC